MIPGCTCGLHGKPRAMTHELRRKLDACALNQKKPTTRLSKKDGLKVLQLHRQETADFCNEIAKRHP